MMPEGHATKAAGNFLLSSKRAQDKREHTMKPMTRLIGYSEGEIAVDA